MLVVWSCWNHICVVLICRKSCVCSTDHVEITCLQKWSWRNHKFVVFIMQKSFVCSTDHHTVSSLTIIHVLLQYVHRSFQSWRINLYQQVKPHLSTFRSESARQRAWKAFEKEIFEMEGNPFPKLNRKEAVPRHLLLHSPVDMSRHSRTDLYRPPPHSPRPCCLMTMEDKILSWK